MLKIPTVLEQMAAGLREGGAQDALGCVILVIGADGWAATVAGLEAPEARDLLIRAANDLISGGTGFTLMVEKNEAANEAPIAHIQH